MHRSILLGGFVAVSLLLLPVAVRSQAQQLTPQSPSQTLPQTEITPLELTQYAQALKQLQVVELDTQKKMAVAIQKEGLSPQRFMEIGQRQYNGSESTASQPSAEEQQKFNKALDRVNQIVQEARPKQQRAITSQGLALERFNQIGQQVQQDPTLKQRVQLMVGNLDK